MKALLFIFLASIFCMGLFAQKNKMVTVKAGSNIMDALSHSEVLYYPVFTNGKVMRKDGSTAEAKLNYNRLVDEMHFIGPSGDTLALSNELTVRYVAVGKDTFLFNDGGYLRIIGNSGRAKLAQKQVWVVSDSRAIGAYNTSNLSSSITSYTSYNEGGKLYTMTVNADLVLKKIEQFYLGNNSNHFVLATKKNLLMLFPDSDRNEVYLKENKIDFSKENDLTKLIAYLGQVDE
jgi:hypothetical protein